MTSVTFDPHVRSDAHRARAERHYSLARSLVQTAPDWATIMLFYAALHQMMRYAALVGEYDRTLSHEDMRQFLRARRELREGAPAYGTLKRLSEVARYRCPPPSHDVMTPSVVGTQILSQYSMVVRCVDAAIAGLSSS